MSNNSFATALQIQNPLIAQSISNTLTTQNSSAFYRVDLIGPSTAHFSVTGLTGNVNLNLFDLRFGNNPIARSDNPSKLSEAIVSQNLAPGTYYLQVELVGASTADYTFNVSARTTADLSNIFWRNVPANKIRMWEMDSVNIGAENNFDTPGQNINLPPEWQAQLFADFNGDGDDDMLWRNMTNGDLVFWTMDGSRIKNTSYFAGVPIDFEVQKVGDLNLDGRVDIVWKHRTEGTVSVWIMDPTGMFYEDFNYFTFPLLPWHIQQMGDLNGDNVQDLVFRHDDGTLALWIMDGKNIGKSGFIEGVPNSWQIQFVGDLNGDDKTDLIWRDTVNGNVGLWLMDELSPFRQIDIPESIDMQIKQVGDVNGDGRADLVWQNRQTGQASVWLTNPDGLTFSDRGAFLLNGNPVGDLPGWDIVSIADFNNDQKEDLIFRNEQTRQLAVWQINGRTLETFRIYDNIDPNWRINGIPKRKLRGGESSISGVTPATAFSIGTLDTRDRVAIYRDVVTAANTDFYSFRLDARSRVRGVDFNQPNASIQVFRADANGNLGQEVFVIPNTFLDSGDYFIRISTRNPGQFEYRLVLDIYPDLVNPTPTLLPNRKPLDILAPRPPQGSAFPTIDVQGNSRDITVSYALTNTEASAASNFKVRFNLLNVNNGNSQEIAARQALDVVGTGGNSAIAAGGKEVVVTGSVLQNQTFTSTVTLRLPPATDTFWSIVNEKVYLLEMRIDPNNELVERQDAFVRGEEDNLLTPTTGNEQPFSINVINNLFPDLRTRSLSVVTGATAPGQNVTLDFSVENISIKGTPQDARIPMRFFLSTDNRFDSGDVDLELFKPDGSFPDELGPIAGATGSGANQTPGVGTGRTTLRLPSFSEAPFFWQQFAGRTQDFYLVMSVNDPLDAQFSESDPFNNSNRDANRSTTTQLTGIDAVRLRLSVPRS